MSKVLQILSYSKFHHLSKQAHYCSGVYVGADDKGTKETNKTLHKEIVAFMKPIPFIIKAIPEVTISGKWLSDQISDSISSLSLSGFKTRGIITDNQSNLFIHHPDSPSNKIYLFYVSVHIAKNVRNNLLHFKKFVFPSFTYNIKDYYSTCPAGYIAWGDFHYLLSKDEQLQGNLRKAPKITKIKVFTLGTESKMFPLHCPFSMKQHLQVLKDVFQNEKVFLVFLLFFKIVGLFQILNNNFVQIFVNTITCDDGKTTFFRQLANWIEI